MLPAWLETCYLTLVTALIAVGRPEPLRRLLVRAVAGAAFLFSTRKRRRSMLGVRRCFPGLSKRQIRGLVKAGFRSFWEEVFWQCPTGRQWREVRGACVCGLEHLQRSLDAGRGAVLWEVNTFGLRTAAKLALAERGFRVIQVHSLAHLGGLRDYRPTESWIRCRLLRPCFKNWEQPFADRIVYIDADSGLAYTRRLREHLAANRLVAVTADGSCGHLRRAIPFLGASREFATGMISLSRADGVPLLPLFAWRDSSGRLQVVVEPPLRITDRGERETGRDATLSEFARRFERRVRRRLRQFHGWHVCGRAPRRC
jgi:lauroyl/myristoyl acyltransferase